MDFGVSPINHTIFMGKSKPSKHGDFHEWVGKKTDVTDLVISAVFEHMWHKAKETGFFEYELPGKGSLQFVRSDSDDTGGQPHKETRDMGEEE